MVVKRSFGESIQIFICRVLGGLFGLAVAAFAVLGPLNPNPQVPFDQVTGFAVLFLTAVLAYAGMELGGWMGQEPAPMPKQANRPANGIKT